LVHRGREEGMPMEVNREAFQPVGRDLRSKIVVVLVSPLK
jgi:hypothetical protein